MANEVTHTEEKQPLSNRAASGGQSVEEMWQRNSKFILIGLSLVILVVAGFFVYKTFVLLPEEKKASAAMWKAEDYYRQDSARLALNGDGANAGFLRIISNYKGTKAANLAKFYAAASYLKLGDFSNAVKFLKEFKTDDELLNVRAAGLLADAHAESGKKAEAAEQYRKAGTLYPEDNVNSPEYLFRAGLMYQELGKNKEAVDMFSVIKEKYSSSERGVEIDKYLARLGSFN